MPGWKAWAEASTSARKATARARRLAVPSRAGLVRELVRIATVERQQRSGRVEFTDGRHFEFAAVPLPDGNALFTMLDITASRGIESALRERAEALADSTDWVKTADTIKGLQAEWKTIGAVTRGHERAVWERLLGAT